MVHASDRIAGGEGAAHGLAGRLRDAGGRAVRLALSAVLLCASACGTLAGGGGGGENLPSRHIIPFEKPEAGEGTGAPLPFVWIDEDRDLDEPFAVVEGDRISLYVQASDEARSVVVRATSLDGLEFGPAETVLEGEIAWEEDWVGAPSVVVREGTIHLFYLAGRAEPSVGLARSIDGGPFEREDEPVLAPRSDERFDSPSAVYAADGFALYFASQPLASGADQALPAIERADARDAIHFERKGAVLRPGLGCTGPDGEPTHCWDEDFVGAPGARVTRSPAGRLLIDLWYTGGRGESRGIGFAGSFDGSEFSRYRLNPVVDDPSPERAASVVDFGGRLLMYYSDRRGDRRAIGVAVQE